MTARLAHATPSSNGSRSKTHREAAPFGLDRDKIRDVSDDHVAGDVPPCDIETERCLLGAIYLDPAMIDVALPIIREPVAFHAPGHRVIWSAMLAMHQGGVGIDPTTLRIALEQRGQLAEAGGGEVLRGLMEVVHRTCHTKDYATIIRSKYDLRQAAEIGREMTRKALLPGAVASEIATDAAASVRCLSESRTSRRRFAGKDISELEVYLTQEADWLVQDVFTADEPLLMGARSKACKTLQLVDLTVALASGTPWMGTFEVPKRRRVLFITGESNDRRTTRHINLACQIRSHTLSSLNGMVRVEAVDFPNLPSPNDLRDIERLVKEDGFEVVILDPLYRGLAGVDAKQLSEMGAAIKNFQTACSPACVILSHHVIKSAAREYGTPPTLEDMTGAGMAESCGQSWLVGRNEKYAFDGMHDLCVSYGGREGQAGGKRIVFDERQWVFVVEGMHDYIVTTDDERQRQQAKAKADAEDHKVSQARAKILKACRNVKVPQSRTRIRNASGQGESLMGPAFADMVQTMELVQRPYRDGANRVQTEGYILREYATEYDSQWTQTEMKNDEVR
jgi:AAA domain/DnaB-like helicase N terminal domain